MVDIWKRSALHAAGIITTLGVLMALVLIYGAAQHQRAAEAFWGKLYSPAQWNDVFADWRLRWLLPKGGPIMDAKLAGCPDAPLPLVPVRITADGEPEALCGFGPSEKIVRPDLDPEIHATIVKVLHEEMVSKGPK